MSESFGQVVQDIEKEALQKFQELGDEVKAFLKKEVPVVEAGLGVVIKQLLSIGLKAVFDQAVNYASNPGHVKFSNAVVATYQEAVGAGLPILFQDAQMAVQYGYRQLQATVTQ